MSFKTLNCDESVAIKYLVARHEKVMVSVLELLVRDQIAKIRIGVLYNPITPSFLRDEKTRILNSQAYSYSWL